MVGYNLLTETIMKRILTTILCAGLMSFISCESDLESKGIAKGIIRYPSIEVLGETPFVLEAGSTFDDPGAKAFLGEDEITDHQWTHGAAHVLPRQRLQDDFGPDSRRIAERDPEATGHNRISTG